MALSGLRQPTGPILESLLDERVDRFLLSNGLVVLFKRDSSSSLASVQIWVRTGSVHEGVHLGSGLSHFLEHMLFKGTENMEGREIAMRIQAAGGGINAYTTHDRTVYYADLPSESFVVGLEVLADAVFRSTLPEEEVKREKDVILREIDMYLDDPGSRLSQGLFETAFRHHPCRVPIIGHRGQFEQVTRDDLLSYYQSRYVPGNAVLVVVGDLEPEEFRKEAERCFGGLPRRGLTPVWIPGEPEQLGPREWHFFADVGVSHGAMGYKVPDLAHPDSPALRILANLLGQGESSILWRGLRDGRQLVHQIHCSVWNPGSTGLFFVSFLADPAKREKAEEAIEEAMDKFVSEDLEEHLLRKTVRQALAAEVHLRKTMQGQASQLGAAEVVAGDIGFQRVFLRKLAAVKTGDVRRVCRTYLLREGLTTASLNPRRNASSPAVSTGRGALARGFQREDLPNGVILLHQADPRLPNLHFRAIMRGGGLYEDPKARGATSLLATLMAKDTARRSHAEIAEAIESAGGLFSNFCGNNTFGLSVEVFPDDAPLAMELLEDALLQPSFLPETFQREKEAETAALQESLDEIVETGLKALRARFFHGHPFAIEPEGTLESLAGLKLDDVRTLHDRLVDGKNLVVAVAGDFEEDRLLPTLRESLGRVPSRGFQSIRSPHAGPAASGIFRETMARQQAVVFLAFPDAGVTGADFEVGEVMDELFSGMSARLFERVREELGLAYFVGSSRVTGVDSGMFYFYAGTRPGLEETVFQEIEAELDRVRQGRLSEEELQRCRAKIKARRRMKNQANSSRAMETGLLALFGLPINNDADLDARTDQVDAVRLRRFAETFFRPAASIRLTIGPPPSPNVSPG